MKKLISALLAVLLLAAPVLAADEPDTLAARFDALRAEYHLDETNFAVSYYNTVTGEEYNWNETADVHRRQYVQAPAQPLLL